jgi:hypothetical protein
VTRTIAGDERRRYPGERRDYGLIRTEDDRVIVHPNSAAAAADGTI